jgi:hypothetical protein
VITTPKARWIDYVNQHTRWNAGAFFSKDLQTRLGYGFIVGYLLFRVLALPFGFLDCRISLLGLNAFLSIGLLGFLGGLYDGKHKVRYFLLLPPYVLFFGFFYSVVSLRALIGRPFVWKGSLLAARSHER